MDDLINKKDLETILEVNKKAVQIQTEVADQNEEIIDFLSNNDKRQDEINDKLSKVSKQNEDILKDIFKIQVLFLSGVLSLVIQIIQIIINLKK